MKAYILQYSNGQSYEDHRTNVLAVFTSKLVVETEVERWNAWFRKQAKRVPELPTDGISDEEWSELYETKQRHIDAIKLPYECSDIRSDLQNGADGSFHSFDVPLLTRK